MRDLDQDVAPSGLRTVDEVVRSNMFAPRILAALRLLRDGLLLAALGVYGLPAV